MRTATKFFTGEKYDDFFTLMKQYCVGGRVAIVAQDAEEGNELSKVLRQTYMPVLLRPTKEDIPEGTRFVIGVGGSGVIPAVKRVAKDVPYAFIPAILDSRFLCDFEGEKKLPEFVFLSEKVRSDRDYALRLYVNIHAMYTEWVLRAVYATAMPFTDRTAEAYGKVGKSLLLGEKGEEDFFAEGLRYVQNSVNAFYERGMKPMLTERMTKICGVTPSERFGIARFLLLVLKNFTKRRFGDILIPSEQTGVGVTRAKGRFFDGRSLPTEEETQIMRNKVAFLSDGEEPELKRLLYALKNNADIDPMFSTMQNEGITDALYYEGFERDQGIFI